MTATSSSLCLSNRARRWFRFSLRTFLIANVAIVLASAWAGRVLARVQQQRQIVRQLEAAGHRIYFDYQLGDSYASEQPPGPWLVRHFLGDDVFASVASVELRADATPADFRALLELPRLNWVSMQSEQIDAETLASVARVPHLRILVLAASSEAEIDLTPLRAAGHLETLFLSGPGIGDKELAPLADLPTLRSLRLSETRVSSLGLKTISRLSNLRTLEFYDAVGVGDAGLSQLVGMKNLQELTVCLREPSDDQSTARERAAIAATSAPITDAGMKSLAQLRQLRYIFLSYTSVTNAGLLELKSLEQLESLHVCGAVTPAGSDALHQYLPKCEISGGDLGSEQMFP